MKKVLNAFNPCTRPQSTQKFLLNPVRALFHISHSISNNRISNTPLHREIQKLCARLSLGRIQNLRAYFILILEDKKICILQNQIFSGTCSPNSKNFQSLWFNFTASTAAAPAFFADSIKFFNCLFAFPQYRRFSRILRVRSLLIKLPLKSTK